MGRGIDYISRNLDQKYNDIFERHMQLTSRTDDDQFFLAYGTLEQLQKEFGTRANSYQKQILHISRRDRER